MEKMRYLKELVTAQIENRKPEPVPENIDVRELEKIARASHMEYLILGALLKSDLPEADKERIRPAVIRSTVKTLQQVQCAQEVERRFEEIGISHQILKGAVMKFIYPAPEQREMSDIDVMVYGESLERAKKIMDEMGFKLVKSVKHHDIYSKNPFLVVEVHWTLYDKNVDKKQFEFFQDSSKTVLKEGYQHAREFTKEQFYVYMIAHMAKHFYENGCGIRNLLDIYIYNQKYQDTMDWTLIHQELKECGLVRFEERVAQLAKKWMSGEAVSEEEHTLFQYMLDCGIYGKGENGLWGQIAKSSKEDSDKEEKHARKWYYFPPISYMIEIYPWVEKYPVLLPVAWFLRGIHGLGNQQGKEKRKMLMETPQEEVRKMKKMYKDLALDFSRK